MVLVDPADKAGLVGRRVVLAALDPVGRADRAVLAALDRVVRVGPAVRADHHRHHDNL